MNERHSAEIDALTDALRSAFPAWPYVRDGRGALRTPAISEVAGALAASGFSRVIPPASGEAT